MNPLSPFTYYRRNKSRTALLFALFCLVTAGMSIFGGLFWGVFIEPYRSNRMYLSKFSAVAPEVGLELDPALVAQIRAHPDVERVLPANMSFGLMLPRAIGGMYQMTPLLAVNEGDLAYIMDLCGATIIAGRVVQARAAEIMVSAQIAAMLDLKTGDLIDDTVNPRIYSNIVDPMQVVGVFESQVPLAVVSYEYMLNHETYSKAKTWVLVVATEGRQEGMEAFLEAQIRSPQTRVYTMQRLNRETARQYQATYLAASGIALVVCFAVLMVMGIVNRITFARRLPEFGILNAVGHSKAWLARQLTLETGRLAVFGWMGGIGLSWLVLYVLKIAMFVPDGHDLQVITLAPVVLTLPVPLMTFGYMRLSAHRILDRMDAVAIVERGELSMEGDGQRSVNTSLAKPLASSTYYLRHRRHSLLVIGAMALMVMAVAFVIFVFSAGQDAMMAHARDLSQMSHIGSMGGRDLDPGIVTRIRTNPDVERVIPFAYIWDTWDLVIPLSTVAEPGIYAVYAEDMHYLVDLYNLELKEGRLPNPNTNELVIPESIARNRSLQVGDPVGDPARPVSPGVNALPVPFVITGIFASPSTQADQNWLAFVSLEFVENHEGFQNMAFGGTNSLFVVPQPGQKDTLDQWLYAEFSYFANYDPAREGVYVATEAMMVAGIKERMGNMIRTVGLIESFIAGVAGIALAVLNYVFVSERRPEFGVLHALGLSRQRLIGRTVRETALNVAAAWGLSAVLCLGLLLYLRFVLYAPAGMTLNLFNPVPWLYTLPIPLAVMVASAGTIAWTLSRLDPVSIIERRTT